MGGSTGYTCGMPILIYRLSNVYLSCIYRISNVVDSEKIAKKEEYINKLKQYNYDPSN